MPFKPWRSWPAIAGLLLVLPPVATAQVSSEQSASVLVFPKIVADGTWDTMIQLANRSNSQVSAHCFYVGGSDHTSACEQKDFRLFLTPRQPTHWLVSTGRPVDATDPECSVTVSDCNGAGFDPGDVPPAPPNFHGELLCVEVDSSGAPVSGNHLSGLATVQNLRSGTVAKYNSVGVMGSDVNNSDGVLCLGGTATATCPTGAEFGACPQTWIMSHLADGAEDPLAGAGSAVRTTITLVPCAQDLVNKTPASVTVHFLVTNDLEQTFSASTGATCWADVPLSSVSQIFQRGTLGSDYAQTRIMPAVGSGGFMVVAQQFRSAGPDSARASSMLNLHVEGDRADPDILVIPVGAQ